MNDTESLTDTGEAATGSRGLWGNDDSDGNQRWQRCREREELQQRLQHSERLRTRLFCIERHYLVWSVAEICCSLLKSHRRQRAVSYADPKSRQTNSEVSGILLLLINIHLILNPISVFKIIRTRVHLRNYHFLISIIYLDLNSLICFTKLLILRNTIYSQVTVIVLY